MLTEINAGWSILEKFGNLIGKLPNLRKEDSVAARFVYLFESHGVNRYQIPRIFGHDLTPADVANDDNLLKKLTENMLADACKLFAVQRKWLDGASKQAYLPHFFCNRIEEFSKFIKKFNTSELLKTILFVLKSERKFSDAPAILVIQEEIGTEEDNLFHRYHLCSEFYYSSWKYRPYLTAFVATCFLHKIHVKGLIVPEKLIIAASKGEIIPPIQSVKDIWHPDCMADNPDIFLDSIDYNDRSVALELWLELESKGYMKLGLGSKTEMEARQLFEQELKKYL